MDDILEQTSIGRDIARRSREEARAEERVDTMSALLKHNDGLIDDLEGLARKLVAADYEEHREWVLDRVPLEQLRAV